MATFKLLHGSHVERPKRKDPKKKEKRPRKVFKAGKNDIIVSSTNLLRFNSPNPNVRPKFRKISDADMDYAQAQHSEADQPGNAPPPEHNDALDDLTVEKLKHLAAEEEIDLAGCSTKADIVARIRDTL